MMLVHSRNYILGIIATLCLVFMAFRSYDGGATTRGMLAERHTTGEDTNERKTDKQTSPTSKTLPSRRHEPVGLAPCGEICSYEGTIISNITDIYPEWHKHVDCEDIMQRMAFRNHPIVYPPPEFPPEELVDEFTMFGNMPIQKYAYYKVSGSENKHNFTIQQINDFIDKLYKDESVNKYNNGKCAQDTLKKYKNKIQGKRGVVIGTLNPWLEAICIGYGAAHVTTLEYAELRYEHPKIDAYNPYDFADKYLKGEVEKFDFAASFSSLEHAGLGRYTDPINPYGDLEAMAQVWCMTKPGGFFGLGVPGHNDKNFIIWNANRVYGNERLQHLTANWNVHEKNHCGAHYFLAMTKVEY